MGIGGVGTCCKKPVMPWLSAGFRGTKPVMPWLAHAHCGEEALPPLRDKTLPASVVCISTGIIFSLLASNGLKCAFFAMLGEFCTVGVRCAAGEWWFAGKSSLCSGSLRPDRDNFLPARVKRAEMGVFRDAGRVLYRLSSCTPCAGRVLYRLWPCTPCAGRVLYRLRPCIPCAGRVLYRGVCAAWLVSGGLREKVLPARVVCVPTVTIFSLLASKGPKWAFFAMLGEFCTGCGHVRRVRGEFCTGEGTLRG